MGIFAIARHARRRRSVRQCSGDFSFFIAEPDLDDGPGRRHRLLAVHRLPVPGGARAGVVRSSRRSAMSGATANRAVFFSGLTVVLALAGMLLVPTTIFRSLAGGAIIVVLVSVALVDDAAAGDPGAARRQDQRRAHLRPQPDDRARPSGRVLGPDHARRHGQARRVARAGGRIHDRSCRCRTGSRVIPRTTVSGIKTGLAGIETLPDDAQSKQAFDAIVEQFPEAGAQASVEDRRGRRRCRRRPGRRGRRAR